MPRVARIVIPGGPHHITKVELAGGTVNTMAYDGDGKRRRLEDSDGTHDFIWDRENIALDLDTSSTRAAYTHDPQLYGQLISQRRSGASSFHHYDALGSTERLTDSSENTDISYLFKAFGQQTVLSGSHANPFTWVGRLGYYRQKDPSDYWLRARVHNPLIGRFVSRDPIPNGNLYTFPGNSPVVDVDPSGRMVIIAVGGPPAWERPLHECPHYSGWCCELPWGFGPPRDFWFMSLGVVMLVHKDVWHTNVQCQPPWLGQPGQCAGIAHLNIVHKIGGEVVDTSFRERRRRVQGKCVKLKCRPPRIVGCGGPYACDPAREEEAIRRRIEVVEGYLAEEWDETSPGYTTLAVTDCDIEGPACTGRIFGITTCDALFHSEDFTPCLQKCLMEHEQTHRDVCCQRGPDWFYRLADPRNHTSYHDADQFAYVERPAYERELACLQGLLGESEGGTTAQGLLRKSEPGNRPKGFPTGLAVEGLLASRRRPVIQNSDLSNTPAEP